MSTAFVPQQQPQHPGGTPDGPPPVPPYASEASRLLCAGAYLDPGYRDRVIEELYLHEQRAVAPSLGFDAARVLAHALRARRLETLWAAAVLGLWIVGTPISGNLLLPFVGPSLLLAVAPLLRGRAARPPWYRSLAAFLARWGGRALTVFALFTLASVAFGEERESSSYASSSYGSSGDDDLLGAVTDGLAEGAEPWQAWFGIGVLVVIGLCVAGRRTQFARVVAAELSPARFPDAAGDPAERTGGTAAAQTSPSSAGESEPVATEGSGTAEPSSAPEPSSLPEGFGLHRDAEGFTVARPTGWEREAVPSQHGFDVVNYRSPDGLRRLQVYEVEERSPEESFDLYLSDRTPKADGFEKVALGPLETEGVSGLRLEYRADSLRGEPDVGSWHVQDVRFRSPADGKVYAIAAYGAPTDGIDPELALVLTAVAHFCPPSAPCPSP
ncbi:hypothetical protein ACF1FC_23165 [Streptomyces sp. NPDC014344]|uniref:hypothetical protein n=1 Tax=Streptomyces sp. NPDC014344 TaxID=3364871 RepID=UPI0036FC280B